MTGKDPVYQELKEASGWDSRNDIVINNIKYRRVKKEGATSWRYFRYDPIKWRVLKVEGERIFLCSSMVLDGQRYHNAEETVAWQESTMRSWLNGYGSESNKAGADYSSENVKNFIDSAFSESEKASILDTELVNTNAEGSSPDLPEGEDTTDKLFLLSESEVSETEEAIAYGFEEPKGVTYDDTHYTPGRLNWPTDYARAMGTSTSFGESIGLPPEFSGKADWWLRSLRSDYWEGEISSSGAAYVSFSDGVYVYGLGYEYGMPGVCPALNLKRSALNYFYAGTNGVWDRIWHEDFNEVPCLERYTVTFDSAGGSEVMEQMLGKNSKVPRPEDPVYDGYTFLGWFHGEDAWDFENGTVTENLTLTAKWEEHEHSWDEGEVTTEPTCVKEGEKTFRCRTCKATKTEKISATGKHTYDEGTVTKKPTCGEDGERTCTCTQCQATKTETIPATEAHSWDEGKVTTEPTCVKKGEKIFQCQTCKTTKTEELPIAPDKHTYDEGTVKKEPTCGEDGERTYTCTGCHSTKIETIPATGEHKWDEGKVTIEPTSTTAGERTYTCTQCQTTKTETIPATGEHKWDEGRVTTEPTCGKEGEKTYTCTQCQTIKTEPIPATGEHSWDEGEVTAEPTCVKQGEKTYKCQVCEAEKTEEVPATGVHKWDEGEVTTEPTCVEEGEKTFRCQTCTETRTEKVEATGIHKWDEGKVTKEPTSTTAGERTYTCTQCQATRTESIPAAGTHSWDEGKVTTAPTCATAGERTYTCTQCQATRTESIPATGAHSWDEGKVTTAPTCVTAGERTYTCTQCRLTKTESIPATGAHSWDEGKVSTAPTCAAAGERTYTCTQCRATKTESIPATGAHSWDEGEITTEPTCIKDGEKTFRCQICKASKKEELPASGAHEYGEYTVLKEATVMEEGVQTRSCRVCGEEEQASIPKLTPTLKLNVKRISLQVGRSTKKVEVSGLAAGDRVKSWKSSNRKIVKVTNTGKITAGKKAGTAIVTVTLQSGKKATVRVEVRKEAVKTRKISGLPKKTVLKRKDKIVLNPVLTPITSTQKLIYTTSNKKVATINRKGVVTAKRAGKTKITVKSGKTKFVVSLTVK